ncbi:MAG: hypothetical protein ACRC68_12290, partial [Clostridium sp.]
MNHLLNKLINNQICERSEEFKELLKEAEVEKLDTNSLWNIEILPPDYKMSLYFILEYKRNLLIEQGEDNERV